MVVRGNDKLPQEVLKVVDALLATCDENGANERQGLEECVVSLTKATEGNLFKRLDALSKVYGAISCRSDRLSSPRRFVPTKHSNGRSSGIRMTLRESSQLAKPMGFLPDVYHVLHSSDLPSQPLLPATPILSP